MVQVFLQNASKLIDSSTIQDLPYDPSDPFGIQRKKQQLEREEKQLKPLVGVLTEFSKAVDLLEEIPDKYRSIFCNAIDSIIAKVSTDKKETNGNFTIAKDKKTIVEEEKRVYPGKVDSLIGQDQVEPGKPVEVVVSVTKPKEETDKSKNTRTGKPNKPSKPPNTAPSKAKIEQPKEEKPRKRRTRKIEEPIEMWSETIGYYPDRNIVEISLQETKLKQYLEIAQKQAVDKGYCTSCKSERKKRFGGVGLVTLNDVNTKYKKEITKIDFTIDPSEIEETPSGTQQKIVTTLGEVEDNKILPEAEIESVSPTIQITPDRSKLCENHDKAHLWGQFAIENELCETYKVEPSKNKLGETMQNSFCDLFLIGCNRERVVAIDNCDFANWNPGNLPQEFLQKYSYLKNYDAQKETDRKIEEANKPAISEELRESLTVNDFENLPQPKFEDTKPEVQATEQNSIETAIEDLSEYPKPLTEDDPQWALQIGQYKIQIFRLNDSIRSTPILDLICFLLDNKKLTKLRDRYESKESGSDGKISYTIFTCTDELQVKEMADLIDKTQQAIDTKKLQLEAEYGDL